jgi:hypothetical protein
MSSKVALKQAAISRLGADFVELPKRGFVNPANQWLNSYLSHQACREMEREDSLAATLFSTEYRRDLPAGLGAKVTNALRQLAQLRQRQ